MGISTHILDTTRGKPAPGVEITLEKQDGNGFSVVGKGTTDADGRVKALLPDGRNPDAGTYRITFDIASYFTSINTESFYPTVSIVFRVRAANEHYHVPLLLNPYGYSTYRGS